ncbi:MAG: hypothetical protein EOP06_16995 [Proteobacteria bacterium]|nr:MAG: hypothetical protein EOP06_16995 [Pseudomonadota bacterium]
MLATKARSEGHSVDPLKHTNCMAGQPRKTGEKAKCYRSGSLHMEDASPKLCSNCVHSCCSQSSIANMEADLIKSNESMGSTSESPMVKKAHSNRIRCITEAIEDAGKAVKRNRDLFAKAEEAWTATVAKSPKFSKSQSTQKAPIISSHSTKAAL